MLNQINDRYNREDKPVYYRGPVSEQEPQAEESQQKDNPQSGEYRTEPEESEAAAEEPKKDSSMLKAPGNTADPGCSAGGGQCGFQFCRCGSRRTGSSACQ